MSAGLRTLLALLVASVAISVYGQAIDVAVHTQGERVIVDVSAHAPVKRDVAWSVLTDYDHMAEFVSNLKTSVVLSRKGNQMEVEQTGEARRGFLHFSFSTVRTVELIDDREIRSTLVRGTFKSYEFVTRISDDPSGSLVIVHHGEYVPTTWVPPVVGPALIETETRRQYTELLAEMTRREARKAAPSR